MFYSLFPLSLIFISLAVIIVVVVRKFPQISALDVENLPEERQAKVKEEIKFQRFSRAFVLFGQRFKKQLSFFGFLKDIWKVLQANFRKTVHFWQEKYKKSVIAEIQQAIIEAKITQKRKKKASVKKAVISVAGILKQAEEAVSRGDFSTAEHYYINAIKLNPKEIEAYRGLGKVYFELKKYREARETFEFILKWQPNDDRVYNRLGMMAEEQGKLNEATRFFEEAIKLNDRLAIRFYDLGRIYAALKRPAAALRQFARAVEIEPNNPKYLDQLLEMSIITGDVDLAKETFDRLHLVNPDNQKLMEFKERIEEMRE